MNRPVCNLLAFAILSVMPVSVLAGEVEESVKQKPESKFYIYAGNCSRSIREVGSFETPNEACWSAENLRDKYRHLKVSQGKVDSPHLLLSNDIPGVESYGVYSRTCKRFLWRASTSTLEEAKMIAEHRSEKGDSVEMILVFPNE